METNLRLLAAEIRQLFLLNKQTNLNVTVTTSTSQNLGTQCSYWYFLLRRLKEMVLMVTRNWKVKIWDAL
jgi:hypothetical protein